MKAGLISEDGVHVRTKTREPLGHLKMMPKRCE